MKVGDNMQTQEVTKQQVLADLTKGMQQVQFDKKFRYVVDNYNQMTPYMRDKLTGELLSDSYKLVKNLRYGSLFKTSVKSDYLLPILNGTKLQGYYRVQLDGVSKLSYYQANVFTRLEYDMHDRRSNLMNNQPYQRLNGLKTFMDHFQRLA